MRLRAAVSPEGDQRRTDQPQGLPLACLAGQGNRPGDDSSDPNANPSSGSIRQIEPGAGEVAADGEQVVVDPREQTMREPRHGEPAGDFPAIAGVVSRCTRPSTPLT